MTFQLRFPLMIAKEQPGVTRAYERQRLPREEVRLCPKISPYFPPQVVENLHMQLGSPFYRTCLDDWTGHRWKCSEKIAYFFVFVQSAWTNIEKWQCNPFENQLFQTTVKIVLRTRTTVAKRKPTSKTARGYPVRRCLSLRKEKQPSHWEGRRTNSLAT